MHNFITVSETKSNFSEKNNLFSQNNCKILSQILAKNKGQVKKWLIQINET